MKLIIMVVALLMTTSSLAQSHKWEMGLGLGTAFTGNTEVPKDELDTGELSGSIWVGYNLSKNWMVLVDYDRLSFSENSNGTDISSYFENINLGLNYKFNPMGSFTPYVGFAVGAGNLQKYKTFDDETQLTPKVRIGADFNIKSNMSLGLVVDYHYFEPKDSAFQASENEFHLFSPMLGFTYRFGATSHKPKAAASDSDNDGVSDVMDKCPGTAAGLRVDSLGCKITVFKDSDGDGIPDDKDKCMSTPAGKKVNDYGCAEKETFEIKLNVKFPSGKSTVSDSYHGQLSQVANFMKEHPSTSAEIEGHTDSMGKESYNIYLSQKRAEAVMNYLVKKLGVDAKRLSAKGYGPAQPIATNKTRTGRATNRRVVATIKAAK